MARIGIALLLLVFFIIIAGIVLYLNRNAAYETIVKRFLAEQGYEAALTIESVTTQRAVVKNIYVAKSGERFARIKTLTATYDWDDIFEGKLISLTLDSPRISVDIDASGKIISDWMPAPSGKPPALPSAGITINSADIDVASPYGDVSAACNIFAKSLTDFTADIAFKSPQLSAQGYSAKVSGNLNAARSGEVIKLSESRINLNAITGRDAQIADADLSLNGDVKIDAGSLTYAGRADIAAQNFTGPFFKASRAVLGFNGRAAYDLERQSVLPSAFDIKSGFTQLSLKDPVRRKDLAQRITLNKTLTATPVAGVFISEITGQIESLLTGADWDADLAVDYNASGYSIDLNRPLKVKNAEAALTLRPAPSGPEFAFSKSGDDLALQSSVDVTGKRPVTLENFSLRGKTDNGYLWTQIESVSGLAKSKQTWREGRTRLAPFNAKITYAGGARSKVKITGPIDYDGPLLGNDFTGLSASGALTLEQVSGGFDLFFKAIGPINAGEIVTPFGYNARDLSLTLMPGQPLLSRRADMNTLALNISDFGAHIHESAGKERYVVRAARADIIGTLKPGGDIYIINAADLDVQSDTAPGPDSRLRASDIRMRFARAPDTELKFNISSPAVRAKAGTVTLKDVALDAGGTPDAVQFSYAGGTVTLAGTNLPPLPVSGKGRFENGRLAGAATTSLDRAPQFPIYVDYVYENGEGSAQLAIPKFIFSPGGVQPQRLAPALWGKIAAVEGAASVRASVGFKPGQPITSKGTISVADMNAGTLVGPLLGLTADLQFDSLYPLRSSGRQTVTMQGFDPGIPLGAGTVTFAVVKDGFDLIEAKWPFDESGGTGEISVQPTFWSTAGAVNKVTVDVRDISLGDLIARFGNEDLSATGQINGTLPVIIDGVNLTVNGGRLSIKDGGVISVRTKQFDRAGEMNDTAKIAVDALRDFKYDELSLDLNGPLDGEMKLGAVFTGSNPEVLGGADFLFRVNIEGELANIARNLSSVTQMQNIKNAVTQKVEDRKIRNESFE